MTAVWVLHTGTFFGVNTLAPFAHYLFTWYLVIQVFEFLSVTSILHLFHILEPVEPTEPTEAPTTEEPVPEGKSSKWRSLIFTFNRQKCRLILVSKLSRCFVVTLLARISSWMFGTLTSWTLLQDQERAPLISQPRSQGSLLPALRSLRSAGRREPRERGCLFPCIKNVFET